VAEVMNSFLTGEPIQIQERAWRLSWDTWNMG